MTTIPEGISALSTAIGIVKTLRDIDRGVQEADYKLKIASATEALADAKMALVEANDELKGKDAEIEKLKKSIRYRAEETIEAGGFTYRKVDGQAVGRAYCPVCLDEGRFQNLNLAPGKGGQNTYQCPRCKADCGWNVPQFIEAEDR